MMRFFSSSSSSPYSSSSSSSSSTSSSSSISEANYLSASGLTAIFFGCFFVSLFVFASSAKSCLELCSKIVFLFAFVSYGIQPTYNILNNTQKLMIWRIFLCVLKYHWSVPPKLVLNCCFLIVFNLSSSSISLISDGT